MVKSLTSFGGGILTPSFGQLMQDVSNNGLKGTGIFKGLLQPSDDLWGPSKNTLLYVKDSTLRVTANGYAVHMKQSDVQQAVHDFATKYVDLINSYAKKLQFPINSPLEIRVTSLDDPAKVGVPAGATAQTPTISALSYDEEAKSNNWDVALWFDVLTLPGTPHSDKFYEELEDWFESRFSGAAGRPMPEWSKGWAYTSNGPWTNSDYIETIRQMFTTGRADGDNWNYAVATLAKYDKFNLFTNEFLGTLFTPTT
jgi:hypothetical protein